jgi:hypothetical protein
MSKEEFLREISKTVKLSIDSNKITYLFFTNNVFLQSHKCGRDRLFEAEYMRVADWQQGITLFTVTDKISRIYPVDFSGQFAQFAKMNFKA